jgi:hypothetical protein
MKILAIDKLKPGVTFAQIAPLLKDEAAHAWKLYLSGVYRELYLRTDRPGAVIIGEYASVDEARAVFAELPLVREGLIEFDFIPLGPFTPFQQLMAT